jgi:hypothetical protein
MVTSHVARANNRDPRFIRKFKKENCAESFVEHAVTKKTRKLWRRKDDTFEYPYKEKKGFST